MPKRVLTWHIPNQLMRGDTGSQGPVYYADHDYAPGALRLHARHAPDGADMQVDIRVDGVSIFRLMYAALNMGANLEENAEDYPDALPEIPDGSTVSFHIIQSGGAWDITGHLEMFTESDDDDDGTDTDEEGSSN